MQIFDFIQVSGQELSIYDGARLFRTGPGDYQEAFRQPIVVRYRGAIPTICSLPAAAIHVDVTMCDFSHAAIGYPHGPGAAISCRWRENLNPLQEIDYRSTQCAPNFTSFFASCCASHWLSPDQEVVAHQSPSEGMSKKTEPMSSLICGLLLTVTFPTTGAR